MFNNLLSGHLFIDSHKTDKEGVDKYIDFVLERSVHSFVINGWAVGKWCGKERSVTTAMNNSVSNYKFKLFISNP